VVQRILTLALIGSGVYLAVEFVRRAPDRRGVRPKPAPLPLSPDYWVLPPKSYVRDLRSARELIGKPLWVREGYRWTCSPGEGTLGPMERVVVKRPFRRGKDVWLELEREGGRCGVPVSTGDSFFPDEIFLIRDPREVYKHWTAEDWKRIAERRVQAGMTETQITFALGYGILVRELSRPGDEHRVVDHIGGQPRARVTYQYGVARKVEPAPPGR